MYFIIPLFVVVVDIKGISPGWVLFIVSFPREMYSNKSKKE